MNISEIVFDFAAMYLTSDYQPLKYRSMESVTGLSNKPSPGSRFLLEKLIFVQVNT
jgi:hypothetical protein